MPENTFRTIRNSLLSFDFVYTTNYDLILYWAMMVEQAKGFKDFFWPGHFNPADTKVWDKCTKILYLHGGLHLYRLASGETFKRRSEAEIGMTLLELFATQSGQEAIPLIISEGTSKDKLRSIQNSDYLSFAYTQLSEHEGPLVIFGHSLSDSDEHLAEAIRKSVADPIAVSIRRDTAQAVKTRKAHYLKLLPDKHLLFFDAETHPLGLPALRIDPNIVNQSQFPATN